ncbi:putative methylene tetrahydrofolate dehydrogenase [Ectocarpus siliculosus]|uniref:Methylene tetrahydrofolate dehydrogenase n=1 Tax=Ectocarpus siliculosus TaxID=2880 RepID=D7FWG9_ECTSI|nr:putative methylene tetrahydrofolate dehydrogenase [Ectocarpus siliculosus]|eukprot:CBJ32057.1 putative methylene tetrahydrofolate dehydrogenase [Ectocarpus siliculosus]
MSTMEEEKAAAGSKVDAGIVAEPFRQEVRKYIEDKLGGVGPRFVGILANTDPAARKYAEWTGRACIKDGIRYEVRECDPEELEARLEECNGDPEVHGVMIYYPVFGAFPSFFGGSMDDYLRDTVSIRKDVEGLSNTYRRNLYHNVRFVDEAKTKKCILPCTPLAVVKIMEHVGVYDESLPVGDRLQGKTVTIINRSEIVGRPLAAMLANDGATIYSIDVDSIFVFKRGALRKTEATPEEAVKQSDVVVTGVPSKAYKLSASWLKEGSAIINVSTFKNVDEEDVLKIPGVRYVPMVGKVTVAMLERNLLRLHENFGEDMAAETLVKRASIDAGSSQEKPQEGSA